MALTLTPTVTSVVFPSSVGPKFATALVANNDQSAVAEGMQEVYRCGVLSWGSDKGGGLAQSPTLYELRKH